MKPEQIWSKELQLAIERGYLIRDDNGNYEVTNTGMTLVEEIVKSSEAARDFLRRVQNDLQHGVLTVICLHMRVQLRSLH